MHTHYGLQRLVLGCFMLLAIGSAPAANADELKVDSDFENGSGVVRDINQEKRVIRIRPGGDPQRGWPNWWFIRVRGIEPGETITLRVDGSKMKRPSGEKLAARWAMPHRAAFSTDRRTWRQTGRGERDGKTIIYKQKVDAKTAWFAWNPAFSVGDAARLTQRIAKENPAAEAGVLCTTRAGRDVPMLRLHPPDEENGEKAPLIVIVARQHAWEAGSSWVCRGMTQWLVSDEARARRLRQAARFLIVPVMDADSVAEGQGGKRQPPHDHNRDWTDDPVYESVAEVQRIVLEADAEHRLAMFFDLHNPGYKAEEVFFFYSPQKTLNPAQRLVHQRWLRIARQEIDGPMPLSHEPKISGPDYDPNWRAMSGIWVTRHTSDHVMSVCIENPWNTPHSTPKGYAQVGRQIARSAYRFLLGGEAPDD